MRRHAFLVAVCAVLGLLLVRASADGGSRDGGLGVGPAATPSRQGQAPREAGAGAPVVSVPFLQESRPVSVPVRRGVRGVIRSPRVILDSQVAGVRPEACVIRGDRIAHLPGRVTRYLRAAAGEVHPRDAGGEFELDLDAGPWRIVVEHVPGGVGPKGLVEAWYAIVDVSPESSELIDLGDIDFDSRMIRGRVVPADGEQPTDAGGRAQRIFVNFSDKRARQDLPAARGSEIEVLAEPDGTFALSFARADFGRVTGRLFAWCDGATATRTDVVPGDDVELRLTAETRPAGVAVILRTATPERGRLTAWSADGSTFFQRDLADLHPGKTAGQVAFLLPPGSYAAELTVEDDGLVLTGATSFAVASDDAGREITLTVDFVVARTCEGLAPPGTRVVREVQFAHENSREVDVVTAAADGRFSMRGLPAGAVTLKCGARPIRIPPGVQSHVWLGVVGDR